MRSRRAYHFNTQVAVVVHERRSFYAPRVEEIEDLQSFLPNPSSALLCQTEVQLRRQPPSPPAAIVKKRRQSRIGFPYHRRMRETVTYSVLAAISEHDARDRFHGAPVAASSAEAGNLSVAAAAAAAATNPSRDGAATLRRLHHRQSRILQ